MLSQQALSTLSAEQMSTTTKASHVVARSMKGISVRDQNSALLSYCFSRVYLIAGKVSDHCGNVGITLIDALKSTLKYGRY